MPASISRNRTTRPLMTRPVHRAAVEGTAGVDASPDGNDTTGCDALSWDPGCLLPERFRLVRLHGFVSAFEHKLEGPPEVAERLGVTRESLRALLDARKNELGAPASERDSDPARAPSRLAAKGQSPS